MLKLIIKPWRRPWYPGAVKKIKLSQRLKKLLIEMFLKIAYMKNLKNIPLHLEFLH